MVEIFIFEIVLPELNKSLRPTGYELNWTEMSIQYEDVLFFENKTKN